MNRPAHNIHRDYILGLARTEVERAIIQHSFGEYHRATHHLHIAAEHCDVIGIDIAATVERHEEALSVYFPAQPSEGMVAIQSLREELGRVATEWGVAA